MKKGFIPYIVLLVVLLVAASSLYAWYLDGRIVPHTRVGSIEVGGLNRDQITQRLSATADIFQGGITVNVEGVQQVINPDSIGLYIDTMAAVDAAYARGHEGPVLRQVWERVSSLWSTTNITAHVTLDDAALRREVADIAAATGVQGSDVRLAVSGSAVTVKTDTSPGRRIDQNAAVRDIIASLNMLNSRPIPLGLREEPPHADPATAQNALQTAQQMTARSLTLQYEDAQFNLSRERLASWLVTTYDGDRVVASLSDEKIAKYVTTVATALNVVPVPPQITTQDGRVTGFTPSKVGRSVQESALIDAIVATLQARVFKSPSDTIMIPVKTSQMSPIGLDAAAGIKELIGKATTPFTGSPKNRISNIKNGVKFISGAIVQPGEEFSTLARLGIVDNTTGYLPELVIKGDRTQPEFGGGLCQVSTTLFRALLNAGLPITARRNHSYRVSYYEKDATGKKIGPGLDATIYQPQPDLKFKNDTANPIMIIGYVIGDKATFELYGTKDGRASEIDGPHQLTDIPVGDPIYIQSTDIPVGTKKQVETPHAGGTAIATYTVTYADGHKDTTVFHSSYRPWPAQYLVGVAALSSPSPTPTP